MPFGVLAFRLVFSGRPDMHFQPKYKARQFSTRHPVRWQEGERERLIANAVEKGRVTHVPRGASGYDTHTAGEIQE